MKKSIIAVFFAVTVLIQGCANQPMNGTVLGPVSGQQVQQEVQPGQFLCPETGRWQVGPCGRGTQIPVGQIVQGASGIGKCELIGGAAGAAGGALLGGKEHRGLGAILGAIAGAFAGNKYCENSAGQVVPVGQQQVVSSNDMTGIEKQHVPATGCGVRVQGYSLKEFPNQQGRSCETDRTEFTAKYMAQCHGKGGSLAKDVLCGRSL